MGTTITFLFVAIINLVVKSTVNTDIALAMTTPQPPPTINYTCKTNGSIDVSFSNIVGFSKITVTDVNMVLTGNCTASDGCAKYLQPINQTMHLTDCGEAFSHQGIPDGVRVRLYTIGRSHRGPVKSGNTVKIIYYRKVYWDRIKFIYIIERSTGIVLNSYA